jgi:hypothetical protein
MIILIISVLLFVAIIIGMFYFSFPKIEQSVDKSGDCPCGKGCPCMGCGRCPRKCGCPNPKPRCGNPNPGCPFC